MNKIRELYNKLAPDKQGHLTLGLLLGLAFGANFILAVVVVVMAGLGKEIYDYVANVYFGTSHEVSLLDALATFVGGMIGIIVVSVIHLIVGRIL